MTKTSDVKATHDAIDKVLTDVLLAIQRDGYSPTTAIRIVRKRLELLEANRDAGWVIRNDTKAFLRRLGAKVGGART